MDLWAVGVLTYLLSTGKPPFQANEKALLIVKMQNEPINYEPFDKGSLKNCGNFIKQVLEYNPKNKRTASEFLHHKWFSFASGSKNTISTEDSIHQDAPAQLNTFAISSQFVDELKKLYVEKILSKEKEKEYVIAFQKLDINGNGTLKKNEFLYAMQVNEIGINEREQQLLLQRFSDPNKEIDYNEFIVSIMQNQEIQNNETIDQMFYYLKEKGEKEEFVSKKKLLQLLGNSNDTLTLKIIDEQAKSNKIKQREFQALIKEIIEQSSKPRKKHQAPNPSN